MGQGISPGNDLCNSASPGSPRRMFPGSLSRSRIPGRPSESLSNVAFAIQPFQGAFLASLWVPFQWSLSGARQAFCSGAFPKKNLLARISFPQLPPLRRVMFPTLVFQKSNYSNAKVTLQAVSGKAPFSAAQTARMDKCVCTLPIWSDIVAPAAVTANASTSSDEMNMSYLVVPGPVVDSMQHVWKSWAMC